MGSDSDSRIPEELHYSEHHEWLSLDGDIGTVGITDYAQSELGDIVFVELPEVGDCLQKGQSFGTVEAVKTVEELYSPASGEILEVNSTLEEEAEQVNVDAYGEGWMIRLRLDKPEEAKELLSPAAYTELVAGA